MNIFEKKKTNDSPAFLFIIPFIKTWKNLQFVTVWRKKVKNL